jgi:hypothetical protein
MTLTAVPNTPAAEDEKLEMLRIEIRRWRKEKGLSFRFMPAAMWDEAILLARLLNVRRVACVLGLNVEELRRRMEGRQSPGAHTTVSAPADPAPADPDMPGVRVCDLPDIALTPPAAPTACASIAERSKASTEREAARPEPAVRPAADTPRAASAATEEAVLEVTAADGAKLTLRMPVGSFNVSSLIHEFRSRA